MNMYEAVKLAAQHIAEKPHLYSFAITHIPGPANAPYGLLACMLGRIGAMVDYKTGDADGVAQHVLGLGVGGHRTFFDRIVNLQLEQSPHAAPDLHDAHKVAPAMFAYAERYRFELEPRIWPPEGIPHAVRQIFRPQPQLTPQPFLAGAHKLLFGGQSVKYNINSDTYELVT